MFSDVVTMAAQMKVGEIRSLAVASDVHLPTLPDTPTVAAIVPGFDTSSWWGVCAPHGTPSEIVNKLNAEINRGLADPEIKQRFTEMGVLILTRLARGLRQDDRRRNREMGQGNRVRERQRRLIGSVGIAPRYPTGRSQWRLRLSIAVSAGWAPIHEDATQ